MDTNNPTPNQNPQPNNAQPVTSNPSVNQNQPQAMAAKPVTPTPVQPQKTPPPPAAKSGATPSKQSNKSLFISGAIIIVVLALLILVPKFNKSASAPADSGTDIVQTGDDGTLDSPDTSNASGKDVLSRSEALAAYAGKTIMIDDNCAVTPKSQTQTTGTTILVDNDSNASHTITVGPKSYSVTGQHYTLSWLNLSSGTLAITCDGKAVDATIVVK